MEYVREGGGKRDRLYLYFTHESRYALSLCITVYHWKTNESVSENDMANGSDMRWAEGHLSKFIILLIV